jgi:beta-N-acetylhexosaminidase
MIGHLAVPALENDHAIRPATISPTIVSTLLKQQIGFDGLILTDALDMDALNNFGTPEQVSLAALKAGADILLCPRNVATIIHSIEQAVTEGTYTEQELNAHVLKILTLKEKLGLHKTDALCQAPFNEYAELIQEIYDAAATPYNGIESILPLNEHEPNYESVTIGTPTVPTLPAYDPNTHYKKPLLMYLYPGNYKAHRLSTDIIKLLHTRATPTQKTIILLFGSPYCLLDIPSNIPTLVLYEDVPSTHITAKKVLAAKLVPNGQLPVSITVHPLHLYVMVTAFL